MRAQRGPAVVLLAAACVACVACGDASLRRGLTRHQTQAPVESSPPSATPVVSVRPPPAAVTAVGPAQLTLTITDDNGLHPARIPVTLTSASGAATTLVSDAKGTVRYRGDPGFYSLAVNEGCHEAVIVHGGGTAKMGLVAGRTQEGTVRVSWRHRYGPSEPANADTAGDWPLGRKVTITYQVRDHCTDRPATAVSYPTFVFDVSKNLELVGTPVLSSDNDGRARLSVRCTEAGRIGLVARDTANPDERIDLVAAAVGFGGVPECG